MTLDEFVSTFADELEETPKGEVKADTIFKNLEEWGSLTALSIIAMIDESFEKTVTGADLRSVDTIEDLYNLVLKK